MSNHYQIKEFNNFYKIERTIDECIEEDCIRQEQLNMLQEKIYRENNDIDEQIHYEVEATSMAVNYFVKYAIILYGVLLGFRYFS